MTEKTRSLYNIARTAQVGESHPVDSTTVYTPESERKKESYLGLTSLVTDVLANCGQTDNISEDDDTNGLL